MKHTFDLEVDDSRYSTTHYSAGLSLKLITKLAKIIGKPMAVLMGAGEKAEVTGDLLGAAVGALIENLDENSIVPMVTEILSTTDYVDDTGMRPINFNLDFAGRIGHLLKLLKAVLEVQYQDFFGGLVGAMGNLPKVKAPIKAK